MVPATDKDKAEDTAKEVLKAIGEARKHALSLQGVEYSDTLGKDLSQFAKDTEKEYLKVQKKLKKKVTKKKDKRYFLDYITKSQAKLEWFKKAEATDGCDIQKPRTQDSIDSSFQSSQF